MALPCWQGRRVDGRAAQTADLNNPADRFLKTEALTFEGAWDAIFVNPPEHIELDVGSGTLRSCAAGGIVPGRH